MVLKANINKTKAHAKAKKPMARLVPISRKSKTRKAGSAKGKIIISRDFNAPLPSILQR